MNASSHPRRNLLRASGCAALLCFALSSCGNKNKRPGSELVTDKDPVRGFLANIPADTPYAFVAIEPMPLKPVLEWMEGWSKGIQDVMPDLEQLLADEYVDPETKLIYAVMSEFSGNYNVEGIKKLGLSASPRFALYGIGMLPALRMDLDDPEAFKAFVARVESRAGMKSTVESVGNTDFWSYQLGEDHIIMSVVNRQLAWGWSPAETAEVYTPYLLGEKRPEKSMADNDLISPVAKKYGFQAYGAGYIDFARIAQIVLEPTPGLNDEIFQLLASSDRDPVPAECVTETKRMLQSAPRAVFGYENLTATEASFSAGLEINSDLGKRIVAAKTAAPLAGSELMEQSAASLAFGFDVGQLLEIINTELLAVRDNPYQCAWYQEINQLANEGTMFMGMVPAMVSNLRGGAVVFKSMRKVAPTTAPASPPDGSLNQGQLGSGPDMKVEGVVAISSIDPAGLLAWIRTLAPEFSNVTPSNTGTPMALPPSQHLQMLDAPHVVLTKSVLAVSSGEGLAEEASQLLTAAPTSGPFLRFVYDLTAVSDMLAESGTPMPMLDSFFIGRTEIEIEPREDAVFMRTAIEFSPAAPK